MSCLAPLTWGKGVWLWHFHFTLLWKRKQVCQALSFGELQNNQNRISNTKILVYLIKSVKCYDVISAAQTWLSSPIDSQDSWLNMIYGLFRENVQLLCEFTGLFSGGFVWRGIVTHFSVQVPLPHLVGEEFNSCKCRSFCLTNICSARKREKVLCSH